MVLSEIAYYFSGPDLEKVRTRVAGCLEPGGHLVLVHYTGETNYPLTADAVHERFLEWDRTWRLLQTSRAGYRLDLLEKIG